MKSAPAEVIAYLNGTDKFIICDLHKIVLADGTTLRYANYDTLVVWDGQTWASTGPVFEREKTKLSGEITVDSLAVTVTTDASDTIGGVTWMNFAHNGGFEGAVFTLYRCFMSTPGVVIGSIIWFTGTIDVDGGGGMEMNWKVRSRMQAANVDYPKRLYYPTCPYELYGAGCGLNRASFSAAGEITVANSALAFTTDISADDNHFDQGYLVFTSGALSGAAGPIKTNTGGAFIMLAGFDAVPAVGDEFTAYPGCDKTPTMCDAKFDNWDNNRATPFVPLKETVV